MRKTGELHQNGCVPHRLKSLCPARLGGSSREAQTVVVERVESAFMSREHAGNMQGSGGRLSSGFHTQMVPCLWHLNKSAVTIEERGRVEEDLTLDCGLGLSMDTSTRKSVKKHER